MQYIVVFIFYLINIIHASSFATQCFLPTYHRGISNASPIVELWNVSPFDCLSHCITNAGKNGDICASVVYHRHFSTCQLYSHDGTFNDAKIVFANGHDYYNRTSYIGICQDRFLPRKNLQKNNNNGFRVHGVTSFNTKNNKGQQNYFQSNYQNQKSVQSYHLYSNRPISSCSINEKLAYLVMRDYKLSPTVPVGKVNGIDRFACLNYCAQNIEAHGNPITCSLISHDSESEECQLFDNSAKDAGIFTRVEPKKYSVVAEKFCLPKSIKCSEDKHFRVILGKKINDSPLYTFKNIETLTECVSACFEHPYCKAITMRDNQCSLFSTNVDTESNLIHNMPNSIIVDCKC